MRVIEQLLKDVNIPKMVKVRQKFPRPVLKDIAQMVHKELRRAEIAGTIKKGDRIAITAGSRGIANIGLIMKEIVEMVKEAGAHPFIVPAMGSHGGATVEGQIEVLQSFGITEEAIGAPIRATMETILLGTAENGVPVYADKFAVTEADGIIVVGRIKPHTSFRGRYESGLAKMIAIGLGKQKGAETCHTAGLSNMPARIEAVARLAIEKTNIIFGVGIMENAYDETCKIAVIPRERIMAEEPLLLEEAKKNMPQILFDHYDVLVVDELGKNIAGNGMDPNITGRFPVPIPGYECNIQRIAALDLTEETHGNGNGIGLADICTRRAFEKMDLEKTYPNPLTSTVVESARIPMIMDNDSLAIRAAIKTCCNVDYNRMKIVRIKNTLKIDEIYISEHLLDEAKGNPYIDILEEPLPICFDEYGNIRKGAGI